MNKEFYRIFSLIFHKPDKDFVKYLRDDLSEDMRVLDPEMHLGFSKFLAEKRLKSDEEFYNMLAIEYTRLFTTAIPGVPCPPYESIYIENEVMGESTLCALECYNKAGLRVLEKFHDLPDHVAVELEFLYYLKSYGFDEEFNAFMDKHFSKWVLQFCDEVEKNDMIGFYRHAAAMLREVVKREDLNKNSMRCNNG